MRLAPRFPRALGALAFLCLGATLGAQDFAPPGHAPRPGKLHALVGGTVVVRPGEELAEATVLLRDGLIAEVGKEVVVPPGAHVVDCAGKVIYAGFVEPYLEASGGAGASGKEAASPSAGLREGFFGMPGNAADPGRKGPGYPNPRVTPERRVVEELRLEGKTVEKLRELGFTTACVAPQHGIFRGTSALVNLVDGDPGSAVLLADAFQHVAFERGRWPNPQYPGSLMGAFSVIRQSLLDAQHHARDRADHERNPRRRARPTYDPALEALTSVLNRERPLLVESAGIISAYRATKAFGQFGLGITLLADGDEWRNPDLLPARLPIILPLDHPELPRIPTDEDWVQISLDQLRRWDWTPQVAALLAERGHPLALSTHTDGGPGRSFRKDLRLALDRGLSEMDAIAALTITPARFCGAGDMLGTVEPGKIANLTVCDGSYFEVDSKVKEVWIDGRRHVLVEEASEGAEEEEKDAAVAEAEAEKETEHEGEEEQTTKAPDAKEARKELTARAPAIDRGVLHAPAGILIRGATVWTCGPQGTLEDCDVLILDGKIEAVGAALERPELEDLHVIDGEGLHVTPGLIDCHSHSMIVGGVNEGTLPSSAMVRIADVVNSETEHIYRQLAGGLTIANLLHGSANPIGGQNAVIKLKWGAAPDDLLFDAAPGGIKFALGENVKQSNWGDDFTTRFPQSRMGVQTFFDNRFQAARQYLASWERYQRDGGLQPRRDLELEALGEILRGERLIHCHSYRQDEILMLMRLMERYGVTIGTFQHILEGYKVADEMAEHGVGGSAFSDWWAYKFEVYDAIPYAGAIMHERGVVVSFNSDSSDTARTMNLESAKAVKYGGVAEEDALRFVTLNPAIQLGIEERVGSLEPGKDADFVLWFGHPLATDSTCVQTWIEGRKYYDLGETQGRNQARVEERDALLAKARAKQGRKEPPASEEERKEERRRQSRFFEVALETENEHRDVHCLGASCCGAHAGHDASGRELR